MSAVTAGAVRAAPAAVVERTVERAEILAAPGARRAAPRLGGRQKAAIIVRLLLAEGARLPLSSLPEHVQAALTEQIGTMRLVDRATLQAVVEEFVAELDSVGLAFPGGIDGAISMLDGQISASAASRLRRLAGAGAKADPWERIATLESARLLPVLEQESLEVGAVMLSKISVTRAAELLEQLPGERARRLAQTMSRTARVDPETVRRIGLSLVQQFEAQAPQAFETGPVERVGAILNSSPAATRDSVLAGLVEDDPAFAEKVRKAIFTFAHIPARLAPLDVPRILREVPQPALLRALVAAPEAGPDEAAAAEFLLSNLTQRMAEGLRGEITEHAPVSPRDGEAAMAEVVAAIRSLETAGTITLQRPAD